MPPGGDVIDALRKALRRLVVFLAFAYPAALLLWWVVVRFFGGDLWLTAVLLYLPRLVALAPLPLSIAALLWLKRPRLLWTQAVAGLIALFPLMGLVLPTPSFVDAERPTLRVLSFNLDSGRSGIGRVVEAIKRIDADIAFIQESKAATDELVAALSETYPHIAVRPYSLVLSRFPVTETTDHPKIPIRDWPRSARIQRHVVTTPEGKVAIVNVHPISPRGALNMYRFRGAIRSVIRGTAVNDESIDALEYNVQLRRLQIEGAARIATQEPLPIILAGDFNLPDLSQVFLANLGGFQDGFEVAGSGFGYTYPQKFPWMRLDRILASQEFDFVSFDVGCEGLSDHRCVIAELTYPQTPSHD